MSQFSQRDADGCIIQAGRQANDPSGWCTTKYKVLPPRTPDRGDELRAIKRYLATREYKLPWLFVGARPADDASSRHYLIGAIATDAGLPNVHPHTLRHSCGYYLADRGPTSAPCRTISAIAIRLITRVSGRRFEGLWK